MLEELRNLDYHGGKEGLVYFLSDVIGKNGAKLQDAKVICSHAQGKYHLSVEELIRYCFAFGWIQIEADTITISHFLKDSLGDRTGLNVLLIKSSLEQLFSEGVFSPGLFSYDAVQSCYSFKNELFPLSLSCVRNVLISQGFLVSIRELQGSRFYINPAFDGLIAKHCKVKRRQLSLESLKKQIESNETAGEKAELFVLEYEKKRVGQRLSEYIKRISEIDVAAGYDIVSFNSSQSQMPDRFIEVKAIGSSGFFWSKNEYEIAKLKGQDYFLYLVELSRIDEPEYIPEIVQNPAIKVMESDSWLIEAQSYHVRHV